MLKQKEKIELILLEGDRMMKLIVFIGSIIEIIYMQSTKNIIDIPNGKLC